MLLFQLREILLAHEESFFGCLLELDGNVNAWLIDLHDLSSAYQISSGLGVCIYLSNQLMVVMLIWGDAGCSISIGVPCHMACELSIQCAGYTQPWNTGDLSKNNW
jgi:hypothetical protein